MHNQIGSRRSKAQVFMLAKKGLVQSPNDMLPVRLLLSYTNLLPANPVLEHDFSAHNIYIKAFGKHCPQTNMTARLCIRRGFWDLV